MFRIGDVILSQSPPVTDCQLGSKVMAKPLRIPCMEYIIYTDESEKNGKYYSDFYGGLLVRSSDLEEVTEQVEAKMNELRLLNEVKWVKVSSSYLSKYVELMDCLFDLLESGQVKMRMMFTKNSNVPINLSVEQRRATYHMLYYQFFKHAFGLIYSGQPGQSIDVRINLDQLPANGEQNKQFKSYLLGLNRNKKFRDARISLREDQIAEIESHQHSLLQCLDVVLGAMAFRLNNKHREIPEGRKRRGKKTIAKEELYKHILKRIQRLKPNFNIGISTGKSRGMESLWQDPYRHWLFVPNNHKVDRSRHKP